MATKIQQKRVLRWVEKWKARLLLSHWNVTVEFIGQPKSSGYDIVADMTTNPRYTDATLCIYPDFWNVSLSVQQETIVHELMHIVTDTVNNQLVRLMNKKMLSDTRRQDILEGITEHLSKIVFRDYCRNKYGKLL